LTICRSGCVYLLLVACALGQTEVPQLKPRPSTTEGQTTGSALAPDSPVITVQGLCERPPGSSATPSDCKKVITRAEFERVLSVVQPNMPKAAQKQFAGRYVAALMLAEKAHETGLDQGPAFDEQMYISRLQVLARLAGEQMQKDAAKVTDSEIEDYYRQHSSEFKSATYDRIYVPKQKQLDATAPDAAKKTEASPPEMKAEADKLRARAAAGEDFAKLQQEAYDFAGMKLKATNTHFASVRKTNVQPTDVSVFDLKPGEVSQVVDTPQGFMIFKAQAFEDQPLTAVREEVARRVQGEKLKKASDSLQKSAAENTTYDDVYFATPPAPTLRNPGEAPAKPNPAPTPPPGKK
jgi:PPIC-type PPIASE domain